MIVDDKPIGNQSVGIAIKKEDNVNHPKHYEGSTSLECIECMEVAMGINAVCYFCLCNAFKYMWRYKNKNGLEDIKKAKWYLDYADKTIEKASVESLNADIIKMSARLSDLYVKISNKIAKEGV